MPDTPASTQQAAERVISNTRDRAPRGSLIGMRTDTDVRIALTWLTRLRWLALAGQLTAVLVASLWVNMPWKPVLSIMAANVATNVLLTLRRRRPTPVHPLLLPIVLLMDVLLLTGLLAATGGNTNPFSVLYVIHIAMAVVIVSPRWTWTILFASLLCYLTLLNLHAPFNWVTREPQWLMPTGRWLALAVTAGVITYFIGRLRSELQRRDKALASMHETVMRSEQLASLATLAAGAAHGLGTPLATIAVVATELEDDVQRDGITPQTLDDIRLVRAEVNRCRHILDRMNVENMQRSDEPPRPLPVEKLIQDIKRSLSAEQAQELAVLQDTTLRTITVPGHALVQAVQILIQNAFDASPPNARQVSLTLRNTADDFIIEVRDNGVGMSAEQLQHVGEPFFTTKAPQRSMGLGLFLARLVAERLQGTLTLRSATGQGTVAAIKFPVHWYTDLPGPAT
jgi:two-component system sensor histidine kinase RegB